MLRRLFIYLAALVGVTACSDDFSAPSRSGFNGDGSIDLAFSVPEMKSMETRANPVDENSVGSLSVIVYDNDKMVQAQIFTSSEIVSLGDKRYKVNFPLKKELKGKEDLQFYFVANEAASVTGGSGVETLEAVPADVVNSDDKMVMSGKSSLKELIGTEVSLIRNGVKVTVNDFSGDETDPVPGSKTYPHAVFGNAQTGSILSGANSLAGSSAAISSFPSSVGDYEISYLQPTKNTGNDGRKVFIIVEADYQGQSYYYRLDFQIKEADASGQETAKAIDLTPNHWYQFLVRNVSGPGYATPEEASKNPTPFIEYVIHDHSPAVYNMISDGVRELGVSHQIVFSGDASDNGAYLYVKAYSVYEEDYSSAISIAEDMEWLEIGAREDATGDFTVDAGNRLPIGGVDGECGGRKGKLYRYPVRFISTTNPGSVEGTVSVTWKGLTREVPVVWKKNFNGRSLCNVTMRIYDGGDNLQFNTSDYWTFLSGDKPSDNDRVLFGTGTAQNNGKVRNEGLHFPVMYGDGATRWRYEYDVDFSAFKDLEFNYAITLEGNDAGNITVGGSPLTGSHSKNEDLKFTVSRKGNISDDDYTYATGKLVITLTDVKTRNPQRYEIDLYHTGFFHKDPQSHRVDARDPDNYYYYEVVPVQGATRRRYMLDRNLGAKSAEMYIETGDGKAYYGNKDAAGGYYKAAEYNMHNDPTMYDDTDERVSPPGYRVPQQRVLDAIRKSPNMSTAATGSYFAAYYLTEVGPMYFPKVGYLENGSRSGESRAGYYWTKTAATGTEKEEIGRWLRSLMFSGSTSTYINGNVDTYAMSVRCINDIVDNLHVYRTNFNVAGATHVFLYTVEKDAVGNPVMDGNGNEVRNVTTSWPGHAIGNHLTMDDLSHWFNFNYESDVFMPQDLYVIFNFVDAKGKIHSMYREKVNGGSDLPANYRGWKVVDETDDNLKDNSQSLVRAGVPTRLGYWWKCGRDYSSVKCYETKPGENPVYIYRLYWPSDKKAGIHLWSDGVDGVKDITTWKDNPKGDLTENGEYYFYDFTDTETPGNRQLSAIFRDNGEERKENFTTLGEFELGDNMLRSYYLDADGKGHPGVPVMEKAFFVPGDKLRIYISGQTSNVEKIHVWHKLDDKDIAITQWPGDNLVTSGSGNWKYHDVKVDTRCRQIGFLLTKDGNTVVPDTYINFNDVRDKFDSTAGVYVYEHTVN